MGLTRSDDISFVLDKIREGVTYDVTVDLICDDGDFPFFGNC
jgi:hypothetical protein